jgi:hypothetical protein
MVAWIDARAAGVSDARAQHPEAAGRIFSGFEFSLVRSRSDNQPCDEDQHRCGVSYVAPRVHVDYFSYSSWQSLGTPTSGLAAQLSADLDLALNWIRTQQPDVSKARLVIGELGNERESLTGGECASAHHTGTALQAFLDWGGAYAIFWQVLDNAPGGGTFLGFGLYDWRGHLKQPGRMLADAFQSQALSVPTAPSCPSLTALLQAGTSSITVRGSFSNANDAIALHQGSTRWTLTGGQVRADGAGVDFDLPADLSGVTSQSPLVVSLVDSNDVESNGQLVTSLCGSTCYQVAGVRDYSTGAFDHATRGHYIEIYGSFGASGHVDIAGSACAVSYWSATQVNCVVGTDTPTGSQQLTVSTGGAAPTRTISVDP